LPRDIHSPGLLYLKRRHRLLYASSDKPIRLKEDERNSPELIDSSLFTTNRCAFCRAEAWQL